MLGFKHFVAALVLLVVGAQAQATVWSPTSDNIHIFTSAGAGAHFAIFDADTLLAGPALTLNQPTATVEITNVAGDFIFTNDAGDSINLGRSKNFVFGSTFGPSYTDYVLDRGFPWLVSSDVYFVTFERNFTDFSSLYAFDVAPVPEPTTFLLMALALAGLVVYRRRVRV